MNDITNYSEKIFEDIKHINEYGEEFWYARELQKVLEYKKWENFAKVIERAKEACKGSNARIDDHFPEVRKIVEAGISEKPILDMMLSRYACYLIVMNGDPRKEVIALGQTYFAVKTRQQELVENYNELSENQKRLAIREEMANHNKSLAEAAQMAGVVEPYDYAIFQNHGYQGLYFTGDSVRKRYTPAKAKRYSTTWEVLSLRQTFSVPPKQTKSSDVTTSKVKKMPTVHTTWSE